MARFNEILVGRYNRHLQKLFGMKGEPPAPQLASEISPSIALFSGNEERYLQGWNLYSVVIQVTEVGGVTQTVFRMRNPKTSGVIAVVTKIAAASSAANDALQVATITDAGANLPTAVSANRWDRRNASSNSALALSSNTSGGTAGFLLMLSVMGPARTQQDLIFSAIQEIPLLPGDMYEFAPSVNAVGTIMFLTVAWRERPIEDSEVT